MWFLIGTRFSACHSGSRACGTRPFLSDSNYLRSDFFLNTLYTFKKNIHYTYEVRNFTYSLISKPVLGARSRVPLHFSERRAPIFRVASRLEWVGGIFPIIFFPSVNGSVGTIPRYSLLPAIAADISPFPVSTADALSRHFPKLPLDTCGSVPPGSTNCWPRAVHYGRRRRRQPGSPQHIRFP